MTLHSFASTVGLVAMASASVGLWTLRVALAAGGRRAIAAAVSGVEAVLFAVTLGAVVGSLDDPLRMGAYAVGVATGTLLGLAAEERLARGQSLVRIVVDGPSGLPAAILRARGWPVTGVVAEAHDGTAAVLLIVVPDTCLGALSRDLDEYVPDALRTVERLRSVTSGPRSRSRGSAPSWSRGSVPPRRRPRGPSACHPVGSAAVNGPRSPATELSRRRTPGAPRRWRSAPSPRW